MSSNNITPVWLVVMEEKQRLPIKGYYSWLYSEEARKILPLLVRKNELLKVNREIRHLAQRTL